MGSSSLRLVSEAWLDAPWTEQEGTGAREQGEGAELMRCYLRRPGSCPPSRSRPPKHSLHARRKDDGLEELEGAKRMPFRSVVCGIVRAERRGRLSCVFALGSTERARYERATRLGSCCTLPTPVQYLQSPSLQRTRSRRARSPQAPRASSLSLSPQPSAPRLHTTPRQSPESTHPAWQPGTSYVPFLAPNPRVR